MNSFETFGLAPELLKAVEEMGYKEPTEIQARTLPLLLESERDLVGIASTGTGKTAAFSLPLLQKLDREAREPQMLVLCPTRELCMQVAGEIKSFTQFADDIGALAVYGGDPISKQIRFLRHRPQVIVGTPGRTLDLIRRGALKVDQIQWLVLDEADEMLSMGFKDELESILEGVPEERQTLLFSATMPREIARMAKKYMEDPQEVEVGDRNLAAKTVRHVYYAVHNKHRYDALRRIIDFSPEFYGIIFCQTRLETQELANKLTQDSYTADALHGDMSQAQRDMVMRRFRNRNIRLLVATDVAARGLDVQDLTHVINYKLPQTTETYIHRSGRTGRAGKEGISMSLVGDRNLWKMRKLEQKIGKAPERLMIPSGEEVCGKQLEKFMGRVVEAQVDDSVIEPHLEQINQQLEGLDRDELIRRFVSLEFNRFLASYKGARDLNPAAGRDERKGEKRFFHRFHVNLGSKHNLSPQLLIELFNDTSELRSAKIGKIDIGKKSSYFEVDDRFANTVIELLAGLEFKGIPVMITRTEDPPREIRYSPRPHGRGGFDRKKGNYGRKNFGDKRYGGGGGKRFGGKGKYRGGGR